MDNVVRWKKQGRNKATQA